MRVLLNLSIFVVIDKKKLVEANKKMFGMGKLKLKENSRISNFLEKHKMHLIMNSNNGNCYA